MSGASGIIVILFSTWATAASPGSWSGLLRDAAGNTVPEAKVILFPFSSSNPAYTVNTSASGEFVFSSLTPSKYEITVITKMAVFKSAVPIEVNEGARLSTALRLSSVEIAQVYVQEAAAAAQASGGERLSSSEVSSLPLNSRDFSKLLLLAAGTMTDANGAANFTQQFAVNGLRGSATVFAMDSIDTTDPEMGGATFSNFNVDAIQEIEANSGVMLPVIGHGAASYTNVITRSGTNNIHGSAFEFLRNASLDARNYFDRMGPDHRRIPPFIRNEFGGTIGGPFVLPGLYNGRDRTFYFGEYQGFRQILSTTQVFPVPTADERRGIDTTSYPGDTLTVPVSAAIRPVLDRYPLPNDPSGQFGARTYAASSKVTTITDQFSVRVDHKISDKAQLFTRFTMNQVTGPETNPDQMAIDRGFAIRFFDHQRNAGVRYVRTISPHLTSETSLGYIRSTPFFPAANRAQPAINYGDGLFQSFGAPAGSIYGSYSNLYQLRHDMTGICGGHTFQWGTEIRVNRDSTIFGPTPNGAFSFGGGSAYAQVEIRSASGTHDIKPGDPLPDSLIGLLTATPYSFTASIPADFTPAGDKFDEAAVRREAYNSYFQDTWKVKPHLTLSYGLRYEVNSRIHEPTKRTSLPLFFDADGEPTSYSNHKATQEYVINPQPPYDADWNGWGPRLSISYGISNHTVLHLGGAIVTRTPNLWQENFLTASIPYVLNPTFYAQPGKPIPFQNSVIKETLPPPYDLRGNLIFPSGRSTDARSNTVIDLQRWESDIAKLAPDHQIPLPAILGVAKNFRNGTIGSYTFGVDHDFGDFKASVNYVATAGIHLPSIYSPNSYTGADPAFAPFTNFDASGNWTGGYGGEMIITSGSHSTYHSLQTSLTKNSPRAGMGLQASYTYSKSIDDTSAVLGGSIAGAGVVLQTLPQDPWNPQAEKGPSTFDVAHVFTVSWIQLLPLERVAFLRPAGKTLTSGWQFLNITTLMSGPPFTVFSGVQQTGAGAGGTDRPDLVKMPDLSTSRKARDDYFGLGEKGNPSFFSIPIDVPGGTGPNHGRFGNLGRGTFRGPGYRNFDVALIKDTPIGRRGNGELGTLEFRAEFFNVFNVINLGLPSNIVRGSGFGIISKTAGSSRQIQFSLKLIL